MSPGSARLPWAEHNARALEVAHASVPDGQSWCLFSYARAGMSIEQCSEQHAMLVEGWSRSSAGHEPIRVQTMLALYGDVDLQHARFDPWMFASGNVRRDVVAWLCARFRRPIAFWGDGTSMFALAPDEDGDRSPWGALARSLGSFRPGVIAHAVRESSPEAAAFLSFDLPAPTFHEAVLRGAFVSPQALE
jgi:hypothetical protein